MLRNWVLVSLLVATATATLTYTPAIQMNYPPPGTTVTFTEATGIVIDYYIPATAVPNSVFLYFVDPYAVSSPPIGNAGILPDTAQVNNTFTVDLTGINIIDGFTTFLIGYTGNDSKLINTTTFFANVQFTTLKPVMLSPVSNSTFTGSSMDLAFQLPEPPSEGSVTVTLYQHFALVDQYVVIATLNATASNSSVPLWNYTIQLLPDAILPSNLTLVLGKGFPTGVFSISVSYQDVWGNPRSQSDYVDNIVITRAAFCYESCVRVTENESDPDNPHIHGVPWKTWVPVLLLSGFAVATLLGVLFVIEKERISAMYSRLSSA